MHLAITCEWNFIAKQKNFKFKSINKINHNRIHVNDWASEFSIQTKECILSNYIFFASLKGKGKLRVVVVFVVVVVVVVDVDDVAVNSKTGCWTLLPSVWDIRAIITIASQLSRGRFFNDYTFWFKYQSIFNKLKYNVNIVMLSFD